jgi:transcriptional regulator with XRE-family HTH domain
MENHQLTEMTNTLPRRVNLWYRVRMQETLGKRIARLRQEIGLTQQALAARLAISRVAVSHFEMDLTLPSERTVTLLAGLFKLSPLVLVEGTTYPLAKAERLPEMACCYTPLEHDLSLLENDLDWLRRLAGDRRRLAADVRTRWRARLAAWQEQVVDEAEQDHIKAARLKLDSIAKYTKGH